MKSTPTPYTHVGYTRREIQTTTAEGSSSRMAYPVTVPAGTRCHKLAGAHWVVDDLRFMERGSIAHHDADHYGIVIKPEDIDPAQIVEVKRP